MDHPLPYDANTKSQLSSPEKQFLKSSTLPTAFTIRQLVRGDAAGMVRVNEHVQNTLKSTLDAAPEPATVKTRISDTTVSYVVQLVAVASSQSQPQPQVKPISTGISSLIQKLASHTMEKTSNTPDTDVFGYMHLVPFIAGGSMSIPRSSMNRTASLVLNTLGESELGFETWRAVTAGLIEEACSKCRNDGLRYKTIVTTMSFHENEPDLVALRDVFLECGFEEAGLLKEVIERHGKLIGRLTLQKML